jgi:hypothetical protein
MSLHPFQAEHAAMTRLESPVGGEIARLENDFDMLRGEFTERGAVDATAIQMMRDGLDRLEVQGGLLALADDLVGRAGSIRRLVDELGKDKAPGAIDRTRRHLKFQLEQVQALIDAGA